jgi:hypothetical protein
MCLIRRLYGVVQPEVYSMKLTSDICNISLIYLALECSLDFELSVALYRGILNFFHLEGYFLGTPAQSEGKAKANSTFILFAQKHHLFVAHTKKIPHHTTDSTFRSTKSRFPHQPSILSILPPKTSQALHRSNRTLPVHYKPPNNPHMSQPPLLVLLTILVIV